MERTKWINVKIKVKWMAEIFALLSTLGIAASMFAALLLILLTPDHQVILRESSSPVLIFEIFLTGYVVWWVMSRITSLVQSSRRRAQEMRK